MLTGGIDLSVGAVASMAGFVVATLVNAQGLEVALIVGLVAAVLVGLLNGIGVGVFRVHPLIMTLGMSLVVLGLANAWQILTLQTFTGVAPELRTLGSGQFLEVLPNSLVVFIPVAALILLACEGPATGDSSMRSATTPSPRGFPAPARGRCSSSCTSSRRSSPPSLVS